MQSGRPFDERATPETLFEEVRQICHVEGGYPAGWLVRSECPCCGSRRLVAAFEKLSIKHDRCVECDYVCVNPYPPSAVLDKLYSGDCYNRIREYYELPRARQGGLNSAYSAPIELLEKLIARGMVGRKAGAWLDVGGGLGVFANLIKQRLPDWKVSLNEMSPRSAELARELFDLEILTNDVASLTAKGPRFDVVSAVAVLEHVVDPVEFVKDYASLLKPNGTLIIVVPHFTALNVHVSKASNSNVLPPFHLSLFGEGNLKRMLDRIGLFCDIEVMQDGAPSFSLIDHVEHWRYWDTILPDACNEDFRSVRTAEYPPDLNDVLNKLSAAVEATSDYFATHDGRVHLAMVVTKGANA